METLAFILRIVIGLVILIPTAFCAWLYYLIRIDAKTKVRPVDEGEASGDVEAVLSSGIVDRDWLREHGFCPAGVYLLTNRRESSRFVVWQKEREETRLNVGISGRGRMEVAIGTDFGDHAILTSPSVGLQVLPMRPGKWVQTFDEADVAELWIRHTDALEYIVNHTGLRPKEGKPLTVEQLEESIKARYDYLFSLPLWPLRIPYWILSRARLRHNKPVWELPEGVEL